MDSVLRTARPPDGRGRLLGLVVLFAGLVLACVGSPAAARPSIVLVLTDDMEAGLVEYMPSVRRLIVDQGATFARAYFNLPLCCPSRATILTGKYAQNTGVTLNSHEQFFRSGNPASTIAVWLKEAGYRTALVGKYLNGYPTPEEETYVPPGWDYFAAHIGEGGYYYDYKLNQNGRPVSYGKMPGDYSTDVLRTKALSFLEEAAAGEAPFFLVLAVMAPHVPNPPAPRHALLFPDLKAPRPPSFGEADVSDKPGYVRDKPPLSPALVTKLDETFRLRVASLQAVDEAVAAVVAALDGAGRLADTFLVFASDNGLLHGQHRVDRAKGMPYEEVIRMPLHVRGPGVEPGSVLEHLVGNVDLAPTFAEWAGATLPDDVDGRSLAPLLRAGAPRPDTWRKAYPLTYRKAYPNVPQPDWRGVRTRDYLYVEYGTGEREFYDLRTDPYQLENAVGAAEPALLERLSQLTAALNACKGTECRRLEGEP